MKKMNLILKKCKTLSRQLSRTSSYSSLSSQSARHHHQQTWVWGSAAQMMLQVQDVVDDLHHPCPDHNDEEDQICETLIFVGSSRRKLSIKSKYLDHPLLQAIIQKSQKEKSPDGEECSPSVKCEVVLFDHLLWMLDNADPNLAPNTSDNSSLEELADLYLF